MIGLVLIGVIRRVAIYIEQLTQNYNWAHKRDQHTKPIMTKLTH